MMVSYFLMCVSLETILIAHLYGILTIFVYFYEHVPFMLTVFLYKCLILLFQLVRSLSHVLGSNTECGEVRSFLKTIASRLEKTWVPGTSNVLEYLVSIQDLILTAKPLFNALPMMSHTAGESLSLLYNENIIVKSLKTMVCTMMKPPMVTNISSSFF